MPLPGSVTMVTVTEDYDDASGQASTGTVSFTPSVRVLVEDGTVVLNRVTAKIVNGKLLAPDGTSPLRLVATDSPNISPTGWTYLVESYIGRDRSVKSISLPAAASPVMLHTLSPVDPVAPTEVRVRTVEGIAPDATGNIDLPAAVGSAPATRVIATASGLQGGGDLSADRTLSPVYGSTAGTLCQGNDSRLSDARTPTAHTHPTSDVTSLQASLDGKETAGAAATAVAAHVAAGDPHPQYLTSTEGNAAYSALGHTHTIANVTGLQTALDGKARKPVVRDAYVTSGNINLNTGTSSWAPLPSGPTLSIPAAVGDRVRLDATIGRQANSNLLADIGVVVGGVVKRWLGNGATTTPAGTYEGDLGLYHTNVPVRTGARSFTVTSDDIDGGNVVFAILCKVNGAGSALLLASADNPLYWLAENQGPVD